MTAEPLRIAVVIASKGRPEEVVQLLRALGGQSLAPSQIIVSGVTTADTEGAAAFPGVTVIHGPAGSCCQRNLGIEHVAEGTDLCAFLDDDYLPDRHAIAGMSNFFQLFPDVAGANGVLLADGINSAGISYEDALAILSRHETPPVIASRILAEVSGLYGCNMVFRMTSIGTTRFDESLPLYGWQEDIDFAQRVRRTGRLVQSDAFRGVHRGVKRSRTSGVRLGYSQIANPIYLARKGTMHPAYAAKIMLRNLVANHIRSLAPEPWVDRQGRVRGNWLAIRDALRNRSSPGKILEL